MHRNTSRGKTHETLRLNGQKTVVEDWTQKSGDMGVKESGIIPHGEKAEISKPTTHYVFLIGEFLAEV